MLDIKSCLKISFQGDTGFIICETGSSYDQIIDQICTRFNIPQSQRAGLVLSNGQGYVFEQQLLEYFLLLFPCPELTFQLRIDWQKLRRSIEKQSRPSSESSSNPVEQEQPEAEAEAEYVAVPVHRQNCFLGALPTSFAPAPTALRRQHSFVQQQQQHQLQLQQQPPLRALRQLSSVTAARPHHSQAKRLRLQLCQRSRRPAPAAAAPHLALLATAVAAATASRSIRI
ncbi:uncharacterized protein LOC117577842 [Drosophila albomicans]|uniref:Uncharacterized protein LOC117577842 n=1 Tax=Drosophila albomicans TaxID=7291 RepID=A0A6P8ZFS8_DROAB|nr:uncharacterized protein LOC117577842 [Drosophila albomicans]